MCTDAPARVESSGRRTGGVASGTREVSRSRRALDGTVTAYCEPGPPGTTDTSGWSRSRSPLATDTSERIVAGQREAQWPVSEDACSASSSFIRSHRALHASAGAGTRRSTRTRMGRLIFSVNGLAREFSDWGDGSTIRRRLLSRRCMESRKRRVASAERSGPRPRDRFPYWGTFHRICELLGWPQTFVRASVSPRQTID
jgi:hypothetical protein